VSQNYSLRFIILSYAGQEEEDKEEGAYEVAMGGLIPLVSLLALYVIQYT